MGAVAWRARKVDLEEFMETQQAEEPLTLDTPPLHSGGTTWLSGTRSITGGPVLLGGSQP